MVNGMELNELFTSAQDRNKRAVDLKPTNSASTMADGNLIVIDPNGAGDFLVEPTDTMHKQLGSALGIPRKYYRVMQEETPDLLDANVNRWLQMKGDDVHTMRLMSRPDADEMTGRAFLGNRYLKIDALDMLYACMAPLERHKVQYRSQSITDENFYMQVTSPTLRADVTPGDTHWAGVTISTNEVGGGTACVRSLIYRQVCTNGMIGSVSSKAWKRRHVGRADIETGQLQVNYSSETRKASAAAISLQIADAIEAALDPDVFHQQIEMLRAAKDDKVESARPTATVERLASELNFFDAESEAIMKNFIREDDYSRFGLAQAVTATANSLANYDRAIRLEEAGFEIASGLMPNWDAVRTAGVAA